ncbi:sodium/bile acid cotransporter-like [Rhinatrema bivittatum]|uniref:sodium/bile acid cotransporter-like n=1 Tax=Rhinatrema bivittatum TaxID=194408 RepID=UPI00112DA81C|nr:sodium/bile acid cotransporter-like [Rhinatrema bivittatum]
MLSWPLINACFHFCCHRCKRTVSMETGCQNVQLCFAILKVAFAPEIIGALYLFPLLYLLFQAGEGFLLVLVFICYERKKGLQVMKKMIYASVNDMKEELKLQTSLSMDGSAEEP